MTTGICRLVLAWNSLRAGVSATSLGHSSARAGLSSSTRTERPGAHLDGDPGVGLEVVVPVWGLAILRWTPRWRSGLLLEGSSQRRDALGPGPDADVVDEYERGASPWPAGASLVPPELLNDLGVIVAGPARPVTHTRLPPSVSLVWPPAGTCPRAELQAAASGPGFFGARCRGPGGAWADVRHWLSYSSWRRIQTWNASPSSRPLGSRSRIP